MIKRNDKIFQWLSQQLREGAEAQLELTERPSHPRVTDNKLLHELRVYQIELEKQNEELRRVQLALGESRDRYIDLYEFAPVGYITLNKNGIIMEANLRAAKLFGVERIKLINRHFTHYINPKDSDRWHHYFLTARKQVDNQAIELSLSSTERAFWYAHLDCLTIKENDEFQVLRITITDITTRKLMESVWQEQETRLNLAVEGAQLSVWDWNIKTGECLYDQRWITLCGYQLEEVKPHISFWEQSIVPDDRQSVQNALHQHFEGHTSFFITEYRIRKTSGELIWIMDRGKVVERDKEGKPLRMTGVALNINHRKEMEQRLRIAAAAFETQAGILITDEHRAIISANKAFTRITGYFAEEVIGHPPFFLRSGLHDENFYSTLWTSVAHSGYWEDEMWDKRKNGEIFPTWSTVTRVTDTNGMITHYVASLIDISAQKQAEKVLFDAHQQLENQVASTQEELEKIKEESLKINGALDILLKHRETDKYNAQDALSREMEATVFPFLKKLKATSNNINQARLLDIVEANLQQLVSYYGRDNSLSSIYQKLTPTEVQIASLVRQGLSSKLIASTLNLSSGTIGIHRKHIRKKLGLNGSDDNLYSYLSSLAE